MCDVIPSVIRNVYAYIKENRQDMPVYDWDKVYSEL